MTRSEHLQWAKGRALEYVQRGDNMQAFTSMQSDLGKHPELRQAAELNATMGMKMLMGGHLQTAHDMREWIDGFN